MSFYTEDKTMVWVLAALLALLFLWVVTGITRGEEILIKGEKIQCWTQMTERNGTTFTIDTATMYVAGADGAVWQASGNATVDGPLVYKLIDTSFGAFTAGNRGYAVFTYTVAPEVYIFKVPIRIYE